jgi:hypothetical protein
MHLFRALLIAASISVLSVLVSFAETAWNYTTPAVDQIIAQHFQNYSTLETFDTRIQHSIRAHRGEVPAQITVSKTAVAPFVLHVPESSLPPNIPVRLLSAVLNSQLVVVGVPLESRSLLTPDQTFVFTEYPVRVDRVFSAGTTGVAAGQSIVVSKPGGTTIVRAVNVTAVEPDFDPLQMNQPYLFCLHSFDNTGTYIATSFGTYLLKDGVATHASKIETAHASSPPMSVADFLAAVQAAVNFKRQ